MARVVTAESMTKTALYITDPASAPANTPSASFVAPPVAIRPTTSSGTAAKITVSTTATAYLAPITAARLTGVASRCTMLPSSISAPRTLVPMMSAVSGSTTVSPNTPRMSAGHDARSGWDSFSAAVTSTRTSGERAKMKARLRPIVARRVMAATTRPWIPNMGWLLPLSVLDQVGEDAFQRLVGGQQFPQPDSLVPGEHGELTAERAVVGRPYLQPPAGHLDPGHGRAADETGPEPAVIGGTDDEHVRAAGHQAPDRAEVPGGGQPARHDHLDGAGEPLDLFQDVRAEQDRPALFAEPVQQVHHVQPLPRIHAVKRLVQQQDRRIVDQRRRHLDPLAHALGVGGDPPVLRVGHLHDPDRAPGGRLRVGELVQLGGGADERLAGEEGVHRIPLGYQPHDPVDAGVMPARGPGHGQFPAGGREEPRGQVQQGRLPGPIRPEQAGDPGPDRHGDVVDRYDVAIPAGDVAQLDRAHDTPAFRYRAARPPRLAPRSTRNMTPYRIPTLPGRGTWLGEVPPSHCLTPSSTVTGLTRPASRAASGLATGPDRPPVTPIRMEARLQLRKK